MPTYTYETIPQKPGAEPERFELRQSMMDDPLTEHPETGVPVKRVITGGLGIMGTAKGASKPAPSPGHRHGSGCGCGPR